MHPSRLLRGLRVLGSLLPLTACNPGVFDDFRGEREGEEASADAAVDAGRDASAQEAGLDAWAPLDARVQDAEAGLPVDGSLDDGGVLDGGEDAAAQDASAQDADAQDADVPFDAGPTCFSAGSALISYFPLDGSAQDSQGAAVIAQNEAYGPGAVGGALSGGELAFHQSRLDAPGALTIAAWLRLDGVPQNLNAAWVWKGDDSGLDYTAGYWLVIAGPSFLASNAKYLTGVPAQGHLGLALTDGSDEQVLLTDSPFPQQRFAHVVATFDGSRARLYLDGAIVRDEVQQVVPRATTTPLRLASPVNGVLSPLPGSLDEVAFFDRALTPSEVQTLLAVKGVVCTQ